LVREYSVTLSVEAVGRAIETRQAVAQCLAAGERDVP
jgi:hypothetical protein